MKFSFSLLMLALVVSCGSKPVTEEPDVEELLGVWECSDFPSGFLDKVGLAKPIPISRVVIREDGSCSAENFPQRSPYRFEDLPASNWSLVDPSRTPSGAWSVEIAGHYLQCRRKGDELRLRCLISGMDEYAVTYRRK